MAGQSYEALPVTPDICSYDMTYLYINWNVMFVTLSNVFLKLPDIPDNRPF